MNTITSDNQRIHPHKLLMWIAIASICMMFAGWTSAFVVRNAQGNWLKFDLPFIFTISTLVILSSSVTMFFSVKAFKRREMPKYKMLISITAILGVLFMILQLLGYAQMHKNGITLASNNEGVSGSFIYLISGIHLLHMLGGVIALVIVFFVVNFRKNKKVYSSTSLEILSTYWHFVDALWVYLFLFFLYYQKFS
jgi:cytochrome c oxidase subunit III